MDRTLVAKKLLETTEHVALLETHLSAMHQPTLLDHAGAASRGLQELKELFGPVVAEPPTRPCPTCGKVIMAAATLCGFCWTKMSPVVA
ncbi:MAG TPA: hypothetical protein VGL86_26810 [Polyangia bacterium]